MTLNTCSVSRASSNTRPCYLKRHCRFQASSTSSGGTGGFGVESGRGRLKDLEVVASRWVGSVVGALEASAWATSEVCPTPLCRVVALVVRQGRGWTRIYEPSHQEPLPSGGFPSAIPTIICSAGNGGAPCRPVAARQFLAPGVRRLPGSDLRVPRSGARRRQEVARQLLAPGDRRLPDSGLRVHQHQLRFQGLAPGAVSVRQWADRRGHVLGGRPGPFVAVARSNAGGI